jgi:hypothetical protein
VWRKLLWVRGFTFAALIQFAACVGAITPPPPNPTLPTCTDSQRNGLETGVDCGGAEGSPCPVGEGCQVATDCLSKLCDATLHCAGPVFTENAVWIFNVDWIEINKNVLTADLDGVLANLRDSGIKYAFLYVGSWASDNHLDYVMSDADIATAIDALHGIGIKVLALVPSLTTPGADVTLPGRNALYSAITDCMNKGFDGYHDDIEVYNGTLQDWIDYVNGATPVLHGLGKLMTASVFTDWAQRVNPHLNLDFIVTMFYSTVSTFEDPDADAYWQENFGQWNGNNTPPASPVIMGIMNYYGNRNPLTWQLDKLDYLLGHYEHPQLAGFCIWVYEYMGMAPTDWSQWNVWINRAGRTPAPVMHAVTIDSSPIRVPITLDGASYYTGINNYTPSTAQLFDDQLQVTVPAQVESETHHPLLGSADHTGAGTGHFSFVYDTCTSGPYTLSSPAAIDSVYFYALAAGNAKLAIYNAVNYHLEGGVLDTHPGTLLTQSQPAACVANSWNLISVPGVTLPAGDYFIAMKIDTTSMTGTVSAQVPGHGQCIRQGYPTAFGGTFPQVEWATGYDASVYIPAAPYTTTPYSFSHWDDDSTSPLRNVTVSLDMTLTAHYTQP